MENNKFNQRIEVAKLLVSFTVPVVIGLCGFFIQYSISEYQTRQMVIKEITVKLADRRLAIYDRIKDPLNIIYCYIEQVGDWESISAEEVKELRKTVNRVMYSNRAIWSTDTFNIYSEYIDHVAFSINDDDSESRIQAEVNAERLRSEKWSAKSAALFTGVKNENHKESYRKLNDALSDDLALAETMSK